MTDHNICDACETVTHCRKNGCIPLTPCEAVSQEQAGAVELTKPGRCVSVGDAPYENLDQAIAWVYGYEAARTAFAAPMAESASRASGQGQAGAVAVRAWINYPVKVVNGEFAGYGEPELSFKRLSYGYDCDKAEALYLAAPGAAIAAREQEAEAFLRQMASLPGTIIRSSRDLSPQALANARASSKWLALRDGLGFAIMAEHARQMAEDDQSACAKCSSPNDCRCLGCAALASRQKSPPASLQSLGGDAGVSEAVALRNALSRLERAVDLHLGRSLWTQSMTLKGLAYSVEVRKELFAAHDDARAALSLTSTEKSDDWLPIEQAPSGEVVVVGWLDAEDEANPERHDFDYLEDGVWQKHSENIEHFQMCAPTGSRGPKEQPPYTHFMRVMPLPAAPKAAEKIGRSE